MVLFFMQNNPFLLLKLVTTLYYNSKEMYKVLTITEREPELLLPDRIQILWVRSSLHNMLCSRFLHLSPSEWLTPNSSHIWHSESSSYATASQRSSPSQRHTQTLHSARTFPSRRTSVQTWMGLSWWWVGEFGFLLV